MWVTELPPLPNKFAIYQEQKLFFSFFVSKESTLIQHPLAILALEKYQGPNKENI